MTTPSVDPERLVALLRVAMRDGVAHLPRLLRESGSERLSPELLTLQALVGGSERVTKGQGGSIVAGACGSGDPTVMPLAHRIDDAARLLSVSTSTVKRLVSTGEIATVEIAGCRRIPHAALLDLVNPTQGRP